MEDVPVTTSGAPGQLDNQKTMTVYSFLSVAETQNPSAAAVKCRCANRFSHSSMFGMLLQTGIKSHEKTRARSQVTMSSVCEVQQCTD